MPANQKRAAVLNYWHSVEIFTPQSVPKVDPTKGVYNAPDRSGRNTNRTDTNHRDTHGIWPWMQGHKATNLKLERDQAWRHQVFCGIFDIEKVSHHLTDVLGAEREASEQRPPGKGAVASFFVTANGFAVPGSLTISTCAWAVGRATNPGPRDPKWLAGFDEHRVALEEAFLEYSGAMPAPAEDDAEDDDENEQQKEESVEPAPPPLEGRYLDTAVMEEIQQLITEHLGVADALAPAGFRVRTRRVSSNSNANPDDDFVNSFFLNDLLCVRDAVSKGHAGPALLSYLQQPDVAAIARRLDVVAQSDDMASRLTPETVPAGRWPESPGRPLAASQQFAVATALGELSDGEGIFAVNGPPGTGKTTMLRDLIAGVVTERAERLAALTHPTDAFTGKQNKFPSGGFKRIVHGLRPELVGHEIVVASSNNGAVENVTREIPGAKAVENWPEPSRYFTDLAQLALDAHAKLSNNPEKTIAWGLLGAPLGKAGNRTALRGVLMNGNQYDKSATTPVLGLHDRLKAFEDGAERPSWNEAKRSFVAARDRVDVLRARRANRARDLTQLDRATAQAALAVGELDTAQATLRAATDQDSAAVARLAEARAVLQPLEAAWDMRMQLKPGGWANAMSFGGKATRWKEESAPLARQAETARLTVAAEEEVARRNSENLNAARASEQRAAAASSGVAAEVTRLRATVASVDPHFGAHDPAGWTSRDDRQRELQAPWLDEEFNEARTLLFLAGLDLHEAWIANAGYRLRQNFLAAMDALAGQIPRTGHEEAVRGAWQTLFMIVPVISTTFASVDRMFAGLGREDLGWLVVDEAGQATPQAAVGALWRTRRAVVVGDPLQLEPVVGLGEVPQELLRAQHGVDERWMPSRSSVQSLADQLCRYGTELAADDGGPERWVGAPLRMHRRCIDPMFRIANDMAYQGLMIPAAVEKAGPPLVKSHWLDVGGPAEGHWRPEQGDAALAMLQHLVGRDEVPPSDIIVISPFNVVANHLSAMILRDRTLEGVRAGTVHTAQGKEAPLVLLVLGGDPNSPRAKTFATSKPNLLNVALTRAQRRFYVVGERSDWITLPQFQNLNELPVFHPTGHLEPAARDGAAVPNVGLTGSRPRDDTLAADRATGADPSVDIGFNADDG